VDHAGKLCIAVFTFTASYAIVRYVVVGPVDPAHIPLFVLNKAVAWTALVMLGISLSLGPLARLWPHRYSCRASARKELGALGFLLAFGHAVMSVPILTPAYFPGLFGPKSDFTALAEIALAAGVVALLILVPPVATSLPAVEQAMSPEAWRRTQRWAVWALVAAAAHLIYGAPAWARPATWYGGLPPITLLCVLTVAGVLALRMKGRRNRM
jgi:DMSO/TMAO reductase YedYZ heme-binding membrane subunit